MKPFEHLDDVRTPDGRELTLAQHGDDFTIHIDRHELMSSRASLSEEALARLAVTALGDRPAPRILIGGLGMGYTLRAALDALGERPRAEVTVAELFPAVITWNRKWLAHLAGEPLEDSRVRTVEGDVADVLAGVTHRFDAILLDVDNGPHAMSLETNDRLYSRRGLRRFKLGLTPNGVLGVWSAHHEPRFTDRLRHTGFTVTTHRMHASHNRRGRRHVVYIARPVP